MSHPPIIPIKSHRIVSKGSMETVATIRGVTNFLVGSVPKARMALICSVTTIEPSSEAIPDPIRPATMSADNTGPSSLIKLKDTSWPVSDTAPYRRKEVSDWMAKTAPVKNPVKTMMKAELTPIRSICRTISLA